VDGVQSQATDFDHFVVVEKHVVSHVGQHRCVERRDCDFVAGLTHGRNGLNVIVMSMCFENAPHTEGRAQLEKSLVFIGGVDEDGITGLLAANDEHVVVVRAHDEPMYLHR
jgi:hypothetical protein